jgi:hypothetical protein
MDACQLGRANLMPAIENENEPGAPGLFNSSQSASGLVARKHFVHGRFRLCCGHVILNILTATVTGMARWCAFSGVERVTSRARRASSNV